MSSSTISIGSNPGNEISDRQKSVTLLRALAGRKNGDKSSDEESEDLNEIVANAEAIARQDPKAVIGRKKNAKPVLNSREYAEALHRQADNLHLKGDYELALVLYHRAANACPREPRHGIAARRTAAVISSLTNPSKAVKKRLQTGKSVAQLEGIPCPETVAKRAQKIVEESADPVAVIDEIFQCLNSRKDFVHDVPIFRDRRRSTLVSRSRIMLRQLGSMASVALENLQAAFAANDFRASLRRGKELLTIAEPLIDRYRYEVAAHHYLAMSQISLGRHDRALDEATLMIQSAQKSGDVPLKSRSFMTLGRVHLTFRHLDAAAKAWLKLVHYLDEAVPKAWLLHEIGRCYFEMKRFQKALETSYRCLEYAEEGNSQKWLMLGQLLSGQCLVELGRLGEAVIVLQRVRTIAETERDVETRDYVSELVDRITRTLRQADSSSEILQENRPRDQKIVDHKQVCKTKSEDVPKSKEPERLEWTRRINENLVAESTSMSSELSKHRARKIKSPRTLRRKNSRILSIATRRNDAIKIDNSSVSTSDASSTSDDNDFPLVDNFEPSDIADETQDDLFTSRTRIIEKKLPEDANSIEQLFAKQMFVLDEDQCCVDEEPPNLTGKTYVLDI